MPDQDLNDTAPADAEAPAPPVDPNAPKRVTLPSRKVVEVRSHRTLLGADVDAVIAAQSGPGARGVYDIYNALVARMVTELEPGTAGTPVLDSTVDAVLAQRADDYNRLHTLLADAYALVTGRSVIPDLDQWEDPKAPTGDGSAQKPDSAEYNPS